MLWLGILTIFIATHAFSVAAPISNRVVQFDFTREFNADVIVNVSPHGGLDTTQTPVDSPRFAASNYSLITDAAAKLFHSDGRGLPNDGFFPATDVHPDVQLAYRNDDDGNNAVQFTEPGQFSFDVALQKYSEFHLYTTSGQGSSVVQLLLHYENGLVEETQPFLVPRWAATFTPPLDGSMYYLIQGMSRAKSDASAFQGFFGEGGMSVYGFRFQPDPAHELSRITVDVLRVPDSMSGGILFDGSVVFLGGVGVIVPEPSGVAWVVWTALGWIAFCRQEGRRLRMMNYPSA